MKQRAYDYLKRDILAHIDMLEILHLPDAQVIMASEDGALLRYDDLLLLASKPGRAEAFLPAMTKDLPDSGEQIVVLHNSELIEPLERGFGFQTVMECYHAIYQAQAPVSYTLPQGAHIRKLDARYVDFVHTHYHMVDDVSYIRERIQEDMFGVFIDGSIVGFAGTHDERSMGMLEILPEYRRLGLAYCLEAHLINHLLSLGRVPFCQVAIVNEASIRLQEKMGLEISKSIIYWLARGRMK
jgi:tRNA (guanine37-N1)-methyltransferase